MCLATPYGDAGYPGRGEWGERLPRRGPLGTISRPAWAWRMAASRAGPGGMVGIGGAAALAGMGLVSSSMRECAPDLGSAGIFVVAMLLTRNCAHGDEPVMGGSGIAGSPWMMAST